LNIFENSKTIEGQWVESAHGLPAQCWHGLACAAHVAHNCFGSGPRLSGPAAHARSATWHARSTAACTLGGVATSPMWEGGRLHAWSGGARLGPRGSRSGGAYRRDVRRGGGVDGVDDALWLSWRRHGGSATYAEDGGGESGDEKECSGAYPREWQRTRAAVVARNFGPRRRRGAQTWR
jgi:hypothetical protein